MQEKLSKSSSLQIALQMSRADLSGRYKTARNCRKGKRRKGISLSGARRDVSVEPRM